MVDIFEFTDYRPFIKLALKQFSGGSRGQLSKLATHLGVSSALLSQIFNGSKDFTEDQSFSVGSYLGLSETQNYYLLLLVQRERVANHKLKELIDNQIGGLQRGAKKLKGRMSSEKNLTLDEQVHYYSSWVYSAIHSLVSVEQFQTIPSIAGRLLLNPSIVQQVVKTLIEIGLLTEKNNRIKVGRKAIFLNADSPLVTRHHANWRNKSLQAMSIFTEDDFFFTGPMSLSEEDFEQFRKELVQLVRGLAQRIQKTNPERVACLNIDFFSF